MSIGLNSPAPTTSFIVGGIYNPVAPNPAPGQAVAFQLDANGNVLVNIAAGAASGVQYVDGVTQATPTGTVALGKNAANVIHAFTLDTFGNLNVNLAAGSISGGNAAAAPTGAAVPVSADYAGVNISGNLVGVTGLALGATTKAPTIAIVDGSGNQITSFGGGTQFADNAGSGATPIGTLSMGWDSANSKIRALKVDASQDLFVAFSSAQHVVVDNASIAVTGTFFQATQPVSIAAAVDVSDRVARLLGHVTVDNASIAVTGTFFQATQPVSIAAAVDVSDRVGRLLGHVTVDNASLAVTGTFFQATQPVSIAAAVDVSDRVGRLLGHVTVDNASIAVTGTFFQATQPVSIAATISDDVIDRSARLLGHVTIDNASLAVTGTFFQATQPVSIAAAVDVSDRAARLVGVVYGSQGQQIKQTATNFNSQVELATGATLYDARQIRALTSADIVTASQATAANLNATVVFASPQHVVVDSGSVSISGTPLVDVIDRTARLLGHVTVDNASLPVTGFPASQAVTIVDGGSATEGSISDVAVFGDTNGTVSAKLRGLNYQLQQLDLDTRLSNQLLFLLLNQSTLGTSGGLGGGGLAGASSSTLNQAPVPVVPSALQGLVPFFNGNLSTSVIPVKSYSGSLNGWMISNPNASPIYIQCFDTVSPVVLGVTAPSFVLSIPPSGAANILGIAGVSFVNGLQVAATTTYNGNTAPGIGMVVTLFFK